MENKARMTILALVLSFVVLLGIGGPAQAGPSSVSPTVNATNGYPDWYGDSTGMTLLLCTDPANCFFDPVDPANPDSVTLGVGGETFYWMAEGLIDMPGLVLPNPPGPDVIGGQALLVLAVEAAFGNLAGNPVIGDQIVFTRVRIRVDVPVAGTYTVTHPFGVETFEVATPGIRAINSEVGAPHVAGNIGLIGDVGCVALPCDFSLALGGLVDPFLRWDPASPPAAPAGFVGNFNIPHAVLGSPTGRNFFRVDGPAGSNLGGPGVDFVETNLFSNMGQILAPGAGLPGLPGAVGGGALPGAGAGGGGGGGGCFVDSLSGM